MTAPIIPAEALAHHIAILGKTGSGKSNSAKVIVEDGLDGGERVCVIDPTGSWWGLRLNARGKPSKYPVVIFGGLHADVQIGRAHGQAVAEVVATSATPAVIDTRLMTVAERTEFFTAFAQTLLRRNKGPLRLIVDEAHLFAPQGRVADPRSGEMLHAANNLVSLGRSIGLRIVLISQRPAKLHKDSLTQVETLVAMRLIAPQDRRAIEDWIGEWADPAQGKEIVASLPSLPTGDAWIWSPEAGVLKRAHFPLARTYDSGKAPSDDEGAPELRPIELEKVSALLDKAAADIKANDPRALKAEVARLQRELGDATKSAAPVWPDQRDEVARLECELRDVRAQFERLAGRLKQISVLALGGVVVPESQAKAGVEASPARKGRAEPVSRPAGGRTPAASAERMADGAAAVTLTGPQRHLLEAARLVGGYGSPGAVAHPARRQGRLDAPGQQPPQPPYRAPSGGPGRISAHRRRCADRCRPRRCSRTRHGRDADRQHPRCPDRAAAGDLRRAARCGRHHDPRRARRAHRLGARRLEPAQPPVRAQPARTRRISRPRRSGPAGVGAMSDVRLRANPCTRDEPPRVRRARLLAARSYARGTVPRIAILLGHWDGGAVVGAAGSKVSA